MLVELLLDIHSHTVEQTSFLSLSLQDELSHINARLNMGILGCKCLPVFLPFKILFSFHQSSPLSTEEKVECQVLNDLIIKVLLILKYNI